MLPPGVVPFDQWAVKGRWWPTPRRSRQSDAVVIHHSVTDTTGDSGIRQIQEIEAVIYGRRVASRFSMVAYSWLIDTFGTVYEGRGTRFRNGANNDTKGTGYGNATTMSVCFAGNYHPGVPGVPTLQPTPAQLRAAGDLIGWLGHAKELVDTYEVVPHRDVHGTSCPGDNLDDKIAELEMYSRLGGAMPRGGAMQIINDTEARRMWAGWDKGGTQHVREYSNYRGGAVGDPMPGMGFIIDDQVGKGNIVKVT